MDIFRTNRDAWDRKVAAGTRWALPVSSEEIARARQGNWHIILTPNKPVPAPWLTAVPGGDVLCLAGAGGQQGPVLAAAGARVTVLDASPAMLALDDQVATREGLENLRTIAGDMADLGALPDASFDLIVNPVSTCFVPDLAPVWAEAFRVLRPGGSLLTGFMNPAYYIFDPDVADDEGRLEVAFRVPHSDAVDLEPARRQALLDGGEALEFSHTLEAQLGGLLDTGFVITGFYEDGFPDDVGDLVTRHLPTIMACRATRPAVG